MATILNIETSTAVCSAAVSCEGEIEFHLEDYNGNSHANNLGVFIKQSLEFVADRQMQLDAVAVSCGPGSYTGLRIGVSMAKGICFGHGIPLIAIPTLEVLCVIPLLYEDIDESALLCPMIDARRMEVYTALYDRSLHQLRETSAVVINDNFMSDELDKHPIYFFGNGAGKCRDIINHPNARFIDGITPLAKSMPPLAEKAYRKQDFKDVAYFEPFYLKDFIASTPKKLL